MQSTEAAGICPDVPVSCNAAHKTMKRGNARLKNTEYITQAITPGIRNHFRCVHHRSNSVIPLFVWQPGLHPRSHVAPPQMRRRTIISVHVAYRRSGASVQYQTGKIPHITRKRIFTRCYVPLFPQVYVLSIA